MRVSTLLTELWRWFTGVRRWEEESIPDVPEEARMAWLEILNDRTAEHALSLAEAEDWVLDLLSAKPRDGYDIVSCFARRRLKIRQGGAGRIYGVLSSLEQAGYVQSSLHTVDRRMVTVYSVTESGSKRAQAAAEKLERVRLLKASTERG